MASSRPSLERSGTANHEYFVTYVDKSEKEQGLFSGMQFRDPPEFANALTRACNEMAAKGWTLFHVQPNATESGALGVWLYFERAARAG